MHWREAPKVSLDSVKTWKWKQKVSLQHESSEMNSCCFQGEDEGCHTTTLVFQGVKGLKHSTKNSHAF